MKHLYIRADMNSTIATGHVMRCLSIADAAKELGVETTFITADENGRELITGRGFEVIVLHSEWNHLEEEENQMAALITERGISHLMVDSYSVTYEYLRFLSDRTRVIYVDDMNFFPYPVWGLVCYANYYREFGYDTCKLWSKKFLGSSYAPLRREYGNLPAKQIAERIHRILVLSGGSDQYHVIKLLLTVLEKHEDFVIDAVCGRYHTDLEELESRYEGHPRVHIHRTIEHLVTNMREADLVFSAGGSTLYELCACGTPTITYSFADNQLGNVRQFERDGLMAYAGDVRQDDVAANVEQLLGVYAPADYRRALSEKMQQAVDGKGALRIVEGILEEA